MARKRILFVDPVGERGGAEVVLQDLASGLDRKRFEPYVACLTPGPLVSDFRARGIPTFSLRKHRTREIHKVSFAVVALVCIAHRYQVDLVHCNGGTMLLYGGAAASMLGLPCVWHVYDPLSGEGLFEWAFVAAQRHLRPAHTILATPAAAKSYPGTYRHLGPCSTILPGIDVESMGEGADPCRAWARLGVPHGTPLVSMFARLQRNKGHFDLIDAAAQVLRQHPGARFALCGGSLFGLEPDYPEELRRRIAERGLSKQILLLGYVSEAEKRDLLAASSVVVHPARSEPFGIAVLEGMAAGKPVVATDCVGPALTVLHGETGLLVPGGHTEALARALIALLEDPVRARSMGERGRGRALQHFSVQEMVHKVEEVYDSVLCEAHPRGEGPG